MPTIHDYDYEPCPECDSLVYEEVQREVTTPIIRGEVNSEGDFTLFEVNHNHQGPVEIERLECRDCGHVLIEDGEEQ